MAIFHGMGSLPMGAVFRTDQRMSILACSARHTTGETLRAARGTISGHARFFHLGICTCNELGHFV